MDLKLAGKTALIVAQSLEASLLARRLTRWGADVTMTGADKARCHVARRKFDVLLLDHALGIDAANKAVQAVGLPIARRIVLITPGERPRLAALKAIGYNGYLVKPVRAASLAARGYGDAVILARLAHDGVTRDAARDALAALEPEEERARRLSFDRPARTPPELAKWLSRRGFGQEAIETVLAGAADVDAPGASAIP